MDTWLDAVRNLRNYCAHPSMVVGMTSSVVIPDNRDSADVLRIIQIFIHDYMH